MAAAFLTSDKAHAQEPSPLINMTITRALTEQDANFSSAQKLHDELNSLKGSRTQGAYGLLRGAITYFLADFGNDTQDTGGKRGDAIIEKYVTIVHPILKEILRKPATAETNDPKILDSNINIIANSLLTYSANNGNPAPGSKKLSEDALKKILITEDLMRPNVIKDKPFSNESIFEPFKVNIFNSNQIRDINIMDLIGRASKAFWEAFIHTA